MAMVENVVMQAITMNEQRFDGYLCFNLRNTCLVGHLVYNVELDHMSSVRLFA